MENGTVGRSARPVNRETILYRVWVSRDTHQRSRDCEGSNNIFILVGLCVVRIVSLL